MKSSFLVKFFIGATCLFIGLFFATYLLLWDNFESVQALMAVVLPFYGIGIACLWGFGIAADNEKQCVEIEEKVVEKSRRMLRRTVERKRNVLEQYNVLMNMSSRANREYYNVLRRAC